MNAHIEYQRGGSARQAVGTTVLPAEGGAKLDAAMLAGLAFAVVFTALARGAVEPWPLAALELIAAALVSLLAVKVGRDSSFSLHVPAPTWPMVALLALAAVQSVAYTNAAGERVGLSLDVEATRSTALALAALTAAFVVAANVLTTRARLARAAYFLTFYGLAMAVFAFVRYFAGAAPSETVSPAVQGMFVNRNHFAGHMELLLPFPVALVITNAVPGRRLLFAFAAVVIGAAAVASLSRGGMISVGAEMLVMLAASFALKGAPRSKLSAPLTAGAVTLLAAGIVAGALWLDRGRVADRVTEGRLTSAEPGVETLFTSRGWLWQETLEMFRAHPVAGVGLGAYATAYPSFSRADRRTAPEQAHNDYLQILADAGLIGGALAACFVALAVAEMVRGLRRARDPLLAATALGGVAGVAGLMVHSVFDFNLQIPANSLLFLLALAVVIQSTRVQSGER